MQMPTKMKRKPPENPLKAARKGSRDAEIGIYNHPIPQHKIHQSKKNYNRAKTKASQKKTGLRLFARYNEIKG